MRIGVIGYGYIGRFRVERYLPVELTAPGTTLEVEVLGVRVPRRVVSMPLYRRVMESSKP